MLTVSLDPGKMGVTRASEYGEDKFNENVIMNFKLYFYTDGSTGDTEAVYVYPAEGYADAALNESATVSGATGTDPTTGKVTVKLKLTEDDVKRIFPSKSSCCVYAVANIAGVADALPESTSINALKKITVKANFGPDASVSEPPYAKAQDSFVMDGEGTLTLDAAKRTASGDVQMYRAASKITFTVTKISKEGVDDKQWEPQPDDMKVSFINGINASYVNGTMDKASRQGANNVHLFSYKSAGVDRSRPFKGNETTGWTHELPFYSYYNLWRAPENSSNADCGDAPYLLLSLPWYNSETNRYFTCWYAVPFNTLKGHLDRNTWYKINLSVSILGSGDPDNPTNLTPSYMILPWGNEVETNANLMRYRYLMVDQNYYEMHNVNSLTIPFISSHEVEVVGHSLTYTKLKPTKGKYKPEENVPVDASNNPYSVNINKDNNALVFKHDLINDYNSNYDVSAYTLKVTIRHKDDSNYYETLTVVQYPALYVSAELNSDCDVNHIDEGTSGGGEYNRDWGGNVTSLKKAGYNFQNRGFVFVNGNNKNNNDWNSVSHYGNTNNKDPYMYVVNVSSLPSNSGYCIGDPRTETIPLPSLGESLTSAISIDGTDKRQLQNYYPADEDGARVNNMIAPSFRIASSYGVTNNLNYYDAKKRCASYQEDGYPAGRWRVPTKAEIMYMVQLAKDGKIPVLLSNDAYYWGSDKRAYCPHKDRFDSPHTNPDKSYEYVSSGRWDPGTYYRNYVRCVYDEWYWTDKCAKGTFTWGDKAR